MNALLGLSLLCAAVEWYAIAAARRRWEYLAKPGALFFLLLWVLTELPRPMTTAGSLFAAGLLFSLLGDVLLLLPRRGFLPGLLAFLVAHLAYSAAFNLHRQPPLLPGALLAAAALGLAALLIGRLAAALHGRPAARLLPALAVYGFVLAVMLWSTVGRLWTAAWPASAAAAVAAGGILFFVSDSLLAWNRFVRPRRLGRLPVMITYHLAQVLLSIGVLAAWTRPG